MRLLFINPSLRRGSPTKLLPVGIGSVMTYLKTKGYDFDLIDVDIDDLDDEAVEARIAAQPYDVILTGCIVTHYVWIRWLLGVARRHHPDATLIVGNSVGGSIAETLLTRTEADVAVIGEGEVTAYEVLEALRTNTGLGGVAGIAYLDGEQVVRTPRREAVRIDTLPMVDWDLLDVQKYFARSDHAGAEGLVFGADKPPRVMPVSTARGCVFKCTFCHYVFWNDPYRHRSPESILGEIERNITRYGATYINFWDDLSFSSLRQAEMIADAILASGLKFNWNAAVRVDLFGNSKYPFAQRLEVAKKFRAAGCLNLGFSLESADEKILAMMEKKIDPAMFIEQVHVLREAGISSSTSVVFGYPIETRETITKTFDMCLEAGTYPSIGFLLPLPETRMYRYAIEHGFIPDEEKYLERITERQDICLNMTAMSDDEIMQHIRDGARRLNEALALGLSEERFIRTGGYRKHTAKTAGRAPIDPDAMARNENDVSFNYSRAIFDIELGTERADAAPSPGPQKRSLPVIDSD